MRRPDSSVTGILLTGGASRRMGFDKASMLVDGLPCAARVATVMLRVVTDAVEVGPGVSGLPAVREELVGSGPLVALCAGAAALEELGPARSALVLACDLPLVNEAVLRILADWPGNHSVVPMIEGQPQTLCARWSASDLTAARGLAETGMRSMRTLLDRPGVELIDETRWPDQVDLRAFSDIDAPMDLERIGLGQRWSPAPSVRGPHPDAGCSSLP